jgi:hypothetical protein
MSDLPEGVRFVRVARTGASEKYHVTTAEEELLGTLDLHYAVVQGENIIHGTLVLPERLEEEREQEFVDLINEEIVESVAPDYARADFILDVYIGQRVSTYSDSEDLDDDDEDDLVGVDRDPF